MNRLHVNSITSIGAVEAGDNPEADILFWKSKTADETTDSVQELHQIDKEESVDKFDIDSLSDDAKAYVSGLEAKLAELTGEPDALPEDLPEVVKARLDTQDAAIAKAQAEKEDLAKQMADLQDQMASEKYSKRAEDLKVLLGDPEDTAPVLKALAQAAPEAFAKLDEQFSKLLNLSGYEALLKEHGDSAAEGSALDQITNYAQEIRKADPSISMAEARVQAWQAHPELKAQAREEGVA